MADAEPKAMEAEAKVEAEVKQEHPVAVEPPLAPLLTAKQMLDRHIVPVKAEYQVRKAAPKPASEVAASQAAGAAGAAGANGQQTKQGGRAEQERGAGAKGRKQMRKDFRAGRGPELCTNHALGRCTYGDTCRFSHDVAEYIRSKPADLPGSCPWVAVQAICPYGVTCRYARTHSNMDDAPHTLLATIPPTPADAAPADATAAAADDVGTSSSSAAAATDASAPAPGTPLPGPLPLPLPAAMDKESNFMSKELQTALWKNRYDFSRADSILKDMGLRISFKHIPKPLPGTGPGAAAAKGGGRGRGGGKGAAAAEAEAGKEETEAMQTDAPAAAAAVAVAAVDGAAAEAGVAAGDAEEETEEVRATKRQRTEEGAAAAATATAAAAEPMAEAEAATSGAAGGTDAAAVLALAASDPAAAASAASESAATAAAAASAAARAEALSGSVELPPRPAERRRLDFRGKTYLAPLTTVGNLPFRRVCKGLGVDVTCGEMALATNLLQGQASEWALLKRHPSEDFFGVQVCGGYPDALARVGQLLAEVVEVDFMDINMGCPIDLVCDKNAGSALLRQPRRIEQIVRATSAALGDTPLTFKTRKGFNDGEDVAHTFLHKAGEWGAAAVTLHGRTRQQRYARLADWDYVKSVGTSCSSAGLQLIGNGDVFSFTDWNDHMGAAGGALAGLMVGRGALIKPWLFTEIKEQRHWDISAGERLDLFKQFCAAGLEHWGADSRGVETTRRFLLEWMSFTCRYVPVGLLEVLPQQLNHRPPMYRGRCQLETLLGSEEPEDWLRISEMLLGRPPAPISFAPKHKSSGYAAAPGASSELDMARG